MLENVPTIRYLTTIAELAAIPAPQPELPEFAFSPKITYLARNFMCIGCREPIHEKRGEKNHIYVEIDGYEAGPYCPTCAGVEPNLPQQGPMYVGDRKRPKRKPRLLSEPEKAWHKGRSFFANKPDREGFDTPFGFTEAWHTKTFNNRHEELSWLIQTQMLELSEETRTLHYNGIPAFSLSSSSVDENDDDIEAANISEHRTGKVALKYDPVTLAPILRNIEWEKYRLACGTATRIYLDTTEDGKVVPMCSDKSLTPAQVNAFAPLLVERFSPIPSAEELDNIHDRAMHYKKLVLAEMKPKELDDFMERGPLTQAYLNPRPTVWTVEDWGQDEPKDFDPLSLMFVPDPDEEGALITTAAPPPTPDGGEQELGQHRLAIDPDEADDFLPEFRVLFEPTESELWPLFDAIPWWMD